ncbi:hypothetical protein NX79_03405 [Xanthomonas vasicola]|nr:hypothetical protein NX04_08385 [Xanthomonas vasicola]KGR45143.1 hypothetical protein NX05_07525 [Xanthomonas vasicola]KGR62056.1 hypothetical protein NX79_03405 [Xanthomonas vasicola]
MPRQAPFQAAARIGVDRGIDRFVAHALGGIVWVQDLELGSNLLGRPALKDKIVAETLEQGTALDKAPFANAALPTQPIAHCRLGGDVGRALLPAELPR